MNNTYWSTSLFNLRSKNTEIVFDKLNNTIHDFIMIVRKHRVSKNYNDVVYMRDGDYYFNVSFLKTITKSELNQETEEFSINLMYNSHLTLEIKRKLNGILDYILKSHPISI